MEGTSKAVFFEDVCPPWVDVGGLTFEDCCRMLGGFCRYMICDCILYRIFCFGQTLLLWWFKYGRMRGNNS